MMSEYKKKKTIKLTSTASVMLNGVQTGSISSKLRQVYPPPHALLTLTTEVLSQSNKIGEREKSNI